VISVTLFLMSGLGPNSSYSVILALLLLGGAGMGLFTSPNMSSVMGSVPAQRRGVASALRATFFNVGFTLSFNIVILVLTFYLPYSLITQIIASQGSAIAIQTDKAVFSSALDNVFLVLTAINTVAIIPSLLRGKRLPIEEGEQSRPILEPE
jgi:MFS family permease